jgi:hypothetical protein
VAAVAAPSAGAAQAPFVGVGPERHPSVDDASGAFELPAIIVREDGYLNTADPRVFSPPPGVVVHDYETFSPPAGAVLPSTFPVPVTHFPGLAPAPTAPETVAAPVQQPVAEPGFDWGDAGIGIAIGMLAAVALAVAMQLARRRSTLKGA